MRIVFRMIRWLWNLLWTTPKGHDGKAMRPSGVHMNKPVAALLVGIIVVIFFVYKFKLSSVPSAVPTETSKLRAEKTQLSKTLTGEDDSKKVDSKKTYGQKTYDQKSPDKVPEPGGKEDVRKTVKTEAMTALPEKRRAKWHMKDLEEVPESILAKVREAAVVEKVVEVDLKNQKVSIFCRVGELEGTKPKLDVLLLHGQAFTSQNWQEIGTLHFLAASGYNPVAVDLPGHGTHESQGVSVRNKGAFLGALIAALKLTTPVIVSPSMSGTFAIPFLFDPGPQMSEMRSRGFIPVAPVGTSSYRQQMSLSQIPAMLIVGEEDKSIGPKSMRDLSVLPNGEMFVIPSAGHAAYMNQPEEFHSLVYNFLSAITAS